MKESFQSLIRQLINNKIILKNTGYLSIIEFFKLLMPFIALPYIIKTVGGTNYGTVVFAQTIISYFQVFVNYGLDVSAVKNVAVNRTDKVKLNHIVSNVLSIKLILFTIAFFILLLLIAYIPYFNKHKLLYSFAFLTCIAELLFPVWYFQGIEKMGYLAIMRFISVVFYTLTVFIFIKNDSDYIFIPLLQSLGNIFAGVLSVYFLFTKEHIRLLFPQLYFMKKEFKNSTPFFVSRVSIAVNNGIAKLIGGLLFSMNTVAAFDLGQKIATVSLIPIQMLNQAVYPHIAKEKNQNFAQKFFYCNILLSFFIALSIFLFAPLAVDFFADSTLPDAVLIARILALWAFFGGIATYIGAPILVSFGFSKPFNNSVILSSIILALLYLLSFILKIDNIYVFAFILVFAEFFMLLYRLYFCFSYKILKL